MEASLTKNTKQLYINIELVWKEFQFEYLLKSNTNSKVIWRSTYVTESFGNYMCIKETWSPWNPLETRELCPSCNKWKLFGFFFPVT